jgi:hypothetical protein
MLAVIVSYPSWKGRVPSRDVRMPKRRSKPHLIERVWAEACDLEWHSLREIARRVRSSYGRVAVVADFLEKYGFIQSHFDDGRWMRISPEAPSPMELANELRFLVGAHGMDLPSRYIF